MTFDLFFIDVLNRRLERLKKNDIDFLFLTDIYRILVSKLFNSVLITILFFCVYLHILYIFFSL